MNIGNGVHLTYCTNIHAGETWAEVQANLAKYIPLVRSHVAPTERFGIGLRLSAQAANELHETPQLESFRHFLSKNNLYVFTLNGFPYGTFHGKRVKEDVYLPDWRSQDRLIYTNKLADLLANLLRNEHIEGSISTVPGAYKSVIKLQSDIEKMTTNLIKHVAHLVLLKRKSGKHITLALEPEPCCFLETIDETVAYFTQHLFGEKAIAALQTMSGLNKAEAFWAIKSHIGLCLDLCHAAVEFEDIESCLLKLQQAEVSIYKMQISAGMSINDFSKETLDALQAFNDEVYLHQVVEIKQGVLKRYIDIPEALESLSENRQPDEWRVHFHVPIFHDELGKFRSTKDFLKKALEVQRKQTISTHLEVETYTWDVLPAYLKQVSIDTAIAHELLWVKEALTT